MGTDKNIKLHIVTDIKCRKKTHRKQVAKMILYRDIFTETDVCTDSYKIELVEDLYYKVEGKHIIEDSSVDDSVFGGNKSAEAEDEGGEEENNKVLIPDFVAASKLEQPPSLVSKNDFKEYIKKYVGKLIKKVGETDADRASFLKANLNEKFVMPLLKDFKNTRFYASDGDEYDLEGGLIYITQEVPDGEETVGTKCTAMILKDALFEEKC